MRSLLYRDTVPNLVADLREHSGKWMSRLIFLLGPWVCLWMVELLNENNVFEDLDPWQIGMNMIWYYLWFILCRFLLGRNRRACTIATVLAFLVGLVNHYILRFRGRILFPADLSGWRTAANVADAFDYTLDVYMTQAAIVLIAYLFLVFVCLPQRKRAKLPLVVTVLFSLLIGGYSYAFFHTDMLPRLGIYTQQWVTQRNGFVLNFTVAMRYSKVDKPQDYTKETVLELFARYPELEGASEGERPVNIVMIMNESFADFSIFEAFEPSEDPLSFLHSMRENTIQGWMYAPVTGGGTASVEFEYLTGFSTLFQPPHTVAYQLYVGEGMPSLSALAREQGYETSAFHPYKSSGWNRVLAYDYLSFDHQLYEQDVQQPWYIRNYISDQSSYETMFRTTQEQETSFIFNVTMQNHSGYAQGWRNLARTIQLSKELTQADATAEQYFDLLKESDLALEQLLAYYSTLDEPTLVVFFGDHQPPLKNAFYEVLYGKKLPQRTTQEVMQQYAVPFFIWANYDIEEQRDVILSPNYLGVLTAELAGLPMTGYMNFLAQLHQQLPVITPVGIVTRDGEFLKREELSQQQQQWLWQYEVLNYCGMVDLFEEARPMFCMEQKSSPIG